MKIAAIITALMLLAGCAFLGWMYMSCTVSLVATQVIATEAADQPETFNQLKEQVADSRMPGTLFRSEDMGEAEDYVFYTYTLRLKNNCFVTADMVEMQVTPQAEDVLQMGATQIHSIPAGSTGEVSATILSRSGGHSVREIQVTFYVWGMPFSMKVTGK